MAATTLPPTLEMRWTSPWGPLPVRVRNGRICAIALDPRVGLPTAANPRRGLSSHPALPGPIRTERDLAALMGRVMRGDVSARDLLRASDLTECTPFERSVLRALAKVRRGRTVSYGALAAQIGAPRAARAVGSALGRNPLPLLLPCHRVLASNGIGGYGGGAARRWRPGGRAPLDFKRELLASEGVRVDS